MSAILRPEPVTLDSITDEELMGLTSRGYIWSASGGVDPYAIATNPQDGTVFFDVRSVGYYGDGHWATCYNLCETGSYTKLPPNYYNVSVRAQGRDRLYAALVKKHTHGWGAVLRDNIKDLTVYCKALLLGRVIQKPSAEAVMASAKTELNWMQYQAELDQQDRAKHFVGSVRAFRNSPYANA